MTDLEAKIRSSIRDIPDFPKEGILFKDITPVIADPVLFTGIADWIASLYRDAGVSKIVGMESRGFIFGAPLVERLGAGLVPARKPGKLPYETVEVAYGLEYGKAMLQLHTDSIAPGEKVLVVDDLLATGGTAAATVELIRRLGGDVVGCCFVIELGFLDGRSRIDAPVRSLIRY